MAERLLGLVGLAVVSLGEKAAFLLLLGILWSLGLEVLARAEPPFIMWGLLVGLAAATRSWDDLPPVAGRAGRTERSVMTMGGLLLKAAGIRF